MKMLKLIVLGLCVLFASGYNLRRRWSSCGDFPLQESQEGSAVNLKRAFIDQHNKWRQEEGVELPNVNWDSELQRQAEANVRQCAMRHDVQGKSTTEYKYIGQNLYMTSLKDLPADQAASKALAAWMSEKKDYTYSTNRCSRVCGHYTQVVWKSSVNIGCAVSQGCSGGTFVACNYGPAGNFFGQKPY